jgi:putative ABC transport system permease protein
VISKIQVDMVWITARSAPMSFVWSVVITMLSACAVDLVLYFRLNKINMAEALKSIE